MLNDFEKWVITLVIVFTVLTIKFYTNLKKYEINKKFLKFRAPSEVKGLLKNDEYIEYKKNYYLLNFSYIALVALVAVSIKIFKR